MIDRDLIKPARQHNESFEAYKVRRANANRVIKQHLSRGMRLWNSMKYIKLSLGNLGLPINPLTGGEVVRVVYIKKPMQGTYRKPFASRSRRGV